MAHHNHTPIWGIILVVIGILLLLETLDLYIFHWSLILVCVGLGFMIFAFSSEDKGGVFPGTIFLLIGLLFFLRYHDILDDPMFLMWPIFLVIIGAAFLLLYIFRPDDWGLLIPAGILLFLGILSFAHNYDFLPWEPMRFVQRYWPLILIAIGAKMLMTTRRRN
jgi:hypothetical protein